MTGQMAQGGGGGLSAVAYGVSQHRKPLTYVHAPSSVEPCVRIVTQNLTPVLVHLILKRPLYDNIRENITIPFFWQWHTRDSYTYTVYNIDDSTRRRANRSVQSTVKFPTSFC
jgi:hypothetical protein